MALKLGITGGIGSGKTTVSRIFAMLGVPLYNADDRARWLIEHDQDLVAGIRTLFGEKAYLPDGSYNRRYIGSVVFNDQDLLERLNALVHPAVARDSNTWQDAHTESPYTVREAALLFESGSYRTLDRVIYVYAPADLRRQRVMLRDKLTAEEVDRRMASQMSEEEKQQMSQYIIYNDGSRSLILQVLDMHHEFLAISAGANKKV